jgi:hypothetical protein
LQVYGFWDYQWDNQSKASVLKVVYTDNLQPDDILGEVKPDGTKIITASYSYEFKNSVLTIRVYVNPNINLNKEDKDWQVENYLLRLMYSKGLNKKQTEPEFYNQFYSQKPYFFAINNR